jgi:hypothetical protein
LASAEAAAEAEGAADAAGADEAAAVVAAVVEAAGAGAGLFSSQATKVKSARAGRTERKAKFMTFRLVSKRLAQ